MASGERRCDFDLCVVPAEWRVMANLRFEEATGAALGRALERPLGRSVAVVRPRATCATERHVKLALRVRTPVADGVTLLVAGARAVRPQRRPLGRLTGEPAAGASPWPTPAANGSR